MHELKFACPQCQQHIQCDEGYGGMEISCPTCTGKMIVPRPLVAPPPPPPVPSPRGPQSAPDAIACPGCGAALAPRAILCTKCGYNLKTGQRITSRGTPVVGRPKPASSASKYFSSPQYVLGFFVVLFLGLYLFARFSDIGGAIFALTALLFYLAVEVIVLVAAFKESVGTGIISLCIPIYRVYFVYFKSESTLLKGLYTLIIGIVLGFTTLPTANYDEVEEDTPGIEAPAEDETSEEQ